MGQKHKPRSGSLAFYPKKRAKKETPSFSNAGLAEQETCVPLNFVGYKAGMSHVIGKNMHEKSPSYGMSTSQAATVIETPPIKIFGIRAYKKDAYGLKVLGDVLAEKADKHLLRKIKAFREKKQKKGKGSGAKEEKKEEEKESAKKTTVSDLEKDLERIVGIRLLAHSQPAITGTGKKKPEIVEIMLSGNSEEQLAYAKEKLGKELSIEEVFKEKQFVDVKAVTKGKGFQGVVKRAGVKIHRPKAKHKRVMGSIGPWHPATVMWTVARPGQLGYQCRTEYNKKILKLGSDVNEINPKAGFTNYGVVKNSFVLLAGSVPGPRKRLIALRTNMRKGITEKIKLEEIEKIVN